MGSSERKKEEGQCSEMMIATKILYSRQSEQRSISGSVMNRKRQIYLWVFIAMIAIFLVSCDGGNTGMTGEMPGDQIDGGAEQSGEETPSGSAGTSENQATPPDSNDTSGDQTTPPDSDNTSGDQAIPPDSDDTSGDQRIPNSFIDAEVVPEIPDGFVPLGTGGNWGDGLRYVSFENQICFYDFDGFVIYGTMYSNQDFIVKYEGRYYINGGKRSELKEIAALAPEVRQETFSVGEAVKIRGAGSAVYTVKITSVKASKTDDVTTYTIKYTATSNDKNQTADFRFISFVESKNGVTYSTYFSTDLNTKTVIVDIVRNETLGAIILTSPEYPGLTYKVVVDG